MTRRPSAASSRFAPTAMAVDKESFLSGESEDANPYVDRSGSSICPRSQMPKGSSLGLGGGGAGGGSGAEAAGGVGAGGGGGACAGGGGGVRGTRGAERGRGARTVGGVTLVVSCPRVEQG